MSRWNSQCNGQSYRETERNCGKESEFYDPSARTSVQEFVTAFMNGETPVEVGFRGIVEDIPQPVNIYPDICVCGYDKYSAETGGEVTASPSDGAATSVSASASPDKSADTPS